ncbi:MAG: endonuclease III, partial [Clostridia bacterium]
MILQSRNNTSNILDTLSNEYPDAVCGLNYSNELELTIALILAAQCTDKMVNKTIPILFKKYNNIYDLKDANISDIENIVKSCGFYKNKSKNILLTVNKIVNEYN